jgi:hypothetical protein
MQFFSLDPTNFRPISILSCLGKLFTAILNERLRRSSEEAFLGCCKRTLEAYFSVIYFGACDFLVCLILVISY